MVSMDISVYKIQNISTGEIRYVNKREVRLLSNYDPRVEEMGQVLPTEGKEPRSKQWKYLKTVVDSSDLLTMTETEAKEYGFVKTIVKSEQEAQAYLGVSDWEVWKYDWGEQAIAFLNSMAVTGLLTAVGLLALYVALNAPGFGVPEVVAIVCFAMIFGSKHMAGIAEWWTIALFVVGVMLLMVELLVLPGFGVAGIAGIACVMVGLLGMIMPSDPGKFPFPRTDVAWEMFFGYLAWLIGGFFAFLVGMIILAKYLPRIPKVGRLVLAEAPAASVAGASHPPDLAPGVDVGQVGVAVGPLHPAGQVRIGQATVDVVTEGELIDAGSEVEVVRREGNRIVVRSKD
jgi:membrane-bound serine protease (ClpP class)